MPLRVSPLRVGSMGLEDELNPEIVAQRAHLAFDRSIRDSRRTLFDFDDTAPDDVRVELLYNRQFKSPLIRMVEWLATGVQPWVRGFEAYLGGREQIRAGRGPYVPDRHRSAARWINSVLHPYGSLMNYVVRKSSDLWGHLPSDQQDPETGEMLNLLQAALVANRAIPESLIQEGIHLVATAADLIPGVDVDANVPRKTASPIYLDTMTVLRGYLPEYRESRIVPQLLAEFGVSEDDIPEWAKGIDDAAVVGLSADIAFDLFNFVGLLLPEGAILKGVQGAARGSRKALGAGIRALTEQGEEWYRLRRLRPDGTPVHPGVFNLVTQWSGDGRRHFAEADALTTRYFHLPLTPDDSQLALRRGIEEKSRAVIKDANFQADLYGTHFPEQNDMVDGLVVKHILPQSKTYREALKSLYDEGFLPPVFKGTKEEARYAFTTLVAQVKDNGYELWQQMLLDGVEAPMQLMVTDAIAQYRVHGTVALTSQVAQKFPRIADFVLDHVKDIAAPDGAGHAYANELVYAYAMDNVEELSDWVGKITDTILNNVETAQGQEVAAAVGKYIDYLVPFENWLLDIEEASKGLPMPIRRLMAPLHSTRSYLTHFDPRQALKTLNASDPITAGETNTKRVSLLLDGIGRQIDSTGGGLDPSKPRQIIPDVVSLRTDPVTGAGPGRIVSRSVAAPGAGLPPGASPQQVDELVAESMGAYRDRLGLVAPQVRHALQANAVFREYTERQFFAGMKTWYGQPLGKLARRIIGDEALPLDEAEALLRKTVYRVPGENAAQWSMRVRRQLTDVGRGDQATEIMNRFDRHFFGMVKAKEGAYYGLFDGDWIPKSVEAILDEGTGGGRLRYRTVQKLASAWKFGKVMTPGLMVRNALTNMSLIFHRLGIRGLDPTQLYLAGKDLNDRTREIPRLIAEHTELLTSSAARHELGVVTDHLDDVLGLIPRPEKTLRKMWNVGNWGFRMGAKAWTWEEEIGKVAVFRHLFPKYMERFGKELGGTEMDIGRILGSGAVSVETKELVDLYQHTLRQIADPHERLRAFGAKVSAEQAEKTLFNYRKVPPVINWMRGYALAPFATFPYKAIPAVVREGLEHPWRVSMWPKMLGWMENLDGRRGETEAHEPEWMETGSFARIPERLAELLGTNGGAHLNLAYMVPWGDIVEQGSLFHYREDPEAFGERILPNIPLLTWLVEMGTGEDQFLGRKIWDKTRDSKRVIREKMVARMAMNVLPGVLGFFGFGGSHSAIRLPRAAAAEWESVRKFYDQPVLRELVMPGIEQTATMQAAYGALQQTWLKKAGRVLKKTGPGSLGFRARPFDLPTEARNRAWDIKRELSDSKRRTNEAVRDFKRRDIGEREYLRRVHAEEQFRLRYLREHPWLVWRSRNHYNPIDSQGR